MKHVQGLCEFFKDVSTWMLPWGRATLRERCILDEQGCVKKFDNFVQDDPIRRPRFCAADEPVKLLRVDARPSKTTWEQWKPRWEALYGPMLLSYEEAWPIEHPNNDVVV